MEVREPNSYLEQVDCMDAYPTFSSSGVSVVWIYREPFGVRGSYGSSWPLTGLARRTSREFGAARDMKMD